MKITIGAIVATVLLGSVASALTLNVTGTTDAAGSCTLQSGTTYNCTTLRAAVTKANATVGTDTINLPAGTITISVTPGTNENANASGDFDVNDSVVINGHANGTTLSGNNLDRIFDLGPTAATPANLSVTISNLTLTNGTAGATLNSTGGAIYNRVKLTLDLVTVTTSTASGSIAKQSFGGGIYSTQPLTLTNSTITSCTAFSGGALESQGGGVWSSGTVTMANTQLTYNMAGNGLHATDGMSQGRAGAIYLSGAAGLTATSSVFDHNTCDAGTCDAGAVYVTTGDVVSTNTKWTYNSAYNGRGGALFLADGSLTHKAASNRSDASINFNTADYAGGAVFSSSSKALSLEQFVALNNANADQYWADTPVDTGGGFLASRGTGPVTIRNAQFSSNKSSTALVGSYDQSGGALSIVNNVGAVRIESVLFYGNTAETAGGAIAIVNGTGFVDILNSTLMNNRSNEAGGAIYVSRGGGARVGIASTTIAFNMTGNDYGIAYGAGVLAYGPVVLKNSLLADNVTQSTADPTPLPDLDCGGALTTNGYNLIQVVSDSCLGSATFGAHDVIGVDPVLVKSGTLASFANTSAAIDAADPSDCADFSGTTPAYDVRGNFPRVQDGNGDGVARCDVGSFELPNQNGVGLSAATYSVPENAGKLTVTVTRTATDGSGNDFLVNYATSNGTASAGTDYTAASGTLTWTGDSLGSKTFDVLVADDGVLDGNKTFNVTLTQNTGSVVIKPASAVVTIVDNEVPQYGQLAIENASYSVGEGGGSLIVKVTRTSGTNGAVGCSYTTINGTALAGSDYTLKSGSLAWGDGVATAQTITIPITQDASYEGNETFSVTISAPTGGATLGTSTSTVTITDDDAPPPKPGTLAFASATDSIGEAGGFVTVTVTRTGGSDGAVSVDWATADGTAGAGDYATGSGMLSWTNGDASAKSFTIAIANDVVDELDETFTVGLSNATGGATVGSPATTTITILDDDVAGVPGTIDVANATATVGEAAGTVTITVNRSGGTTGAVGISYATANVTATAGSDYTTTTGTLTWADGVGGSKTFTVPITSDVAYEGDETFLVELSAPSGGANLNADTTTVTITDDDPIPVNHGSLALGTATSVGEGAGKVTIGVTRTGGTDGAVGVAVKTQNGSATAGSDYVAVDTTVSFADGEGGSKTVDITISDDGLVEGSETFTVNLSNATGGAAIGTSSQTITIDDNDSAGTVAIATPGAVAEGAGSVQLTVKRTGGAAGAASVNYTTQNGTALQPGDYTTASGTLTWTDGDASDKTIVVTLIDDLVSEGSETFDVKLSGAVGASLGSSTASVTVTDDDPSGGYVRLVSSTIAVSEGAGQATLTIERIGSLGGGVTIGYQTVDGSALAPGDYTAATSSVSWTDGEGGQKSVVVTLTDDLVNEATELFTVTFSPTVGSATLLSPVGTIQVDDNDALVVADLAQVDLVQVDLAQLDQAQADQASAPDDLTNNAPQDLAQASVDQATAPVDDLTTPPVADLSAAPGDDLATASPSDLASGAADGGGTTDDLAMPGGGKPKAKGCSVADGRSAELAWPVLFALGALALGRRRGRVAR